MKDRVPRYPGRVTLTPVTGQANTYDMTRADEPTEAGTPLNTASLLTAATAQSIFGDSNDHTVNEALMTLSKVVHDFVYTEFSESGVWTAPANIVQNKITVLCCGGGGGGGANYEDTQGVISYGGGGGSGYITREEVEVVPGQSYSIVIGSGGSAGSSTPIADGGRGGTTIFGDNLVAAEGGYGGKTGTSSRGGNGGNGNAGGGGGGTGGGGTGGNGGYGGTYGGGGGGAYGSTAGNGGDGGTNGGGGGAGGRYGNEGKGGTYGGDGGHYDVGNNRYVNAGDGTVFESPNPTPYDINFSGKAGDESGIYRYAGGGGTGGNGGDGGTNGGGGGGGYGGNGGIGSANGNGTGGGGGGYGGNGGNARVGSVICAGGGGGYFGVGGGVIPYGINSYTYQHPERGGGGTNSQSGASGIVAIWYYTA